MKHILVTGATGGVGKRVVKLLLQQNYAVRALVRNQHQARAMLGEEVELVEADVTQPQTLSSEMLEDVEAIVWCIGTRVQPVEGDTPNREKYYQGIKFYQPEVVDTPQAVEYEGVQNLIKLATASIEPRTSLTLFDFSQPSAAVEDVWGAIDDVVMGGVSSSSISTKEGVAVFTGVVSTDNNGGFASVRTRNFNPSLNLSAYAGIELQVKGDGQRYKFILRGSEKWDGVGYCYSFDTQPNQWISVKIPFSDLIPVFRAQTVDNAEFDASRVCSMQLMLSKFEYDGALNPSFEPGEFSLATASIAAYGGKPKPQFIMISSAGVTRPGRPDLDLSKEPPAVRMNEQLGGLLTWKLRGEEVVKQSGLTYTIIRPCALTEKPGDKQLELAQGDEIQGQVSRDAIARLCVESLKLAEAANKTFEVRETATVANNDWSTLLGSIASE